MRKTLDMMKVTSTYAHTLILFMFIVPQLFVYEPHIHKELCVPSVVCLLGTG